MLIRHCDQCNCALEKNALYLKVGIASDENVEIASGWNDVILGDFCSLECLQTKIQNYYLSYIFTKNDKF